MMQRAALLIRCITEEAVTIRHCAAVERRTVSGYVLNVLDKALKVEDSLWQQLGQSHFQDLHYVIASSQQRFGGDRTTILIRCTRDEATRIRMAAEHRQITISAFVIHSLQRFWAVAKGRPAP